MNKAVLFSIPPEQCCNIANGKQTVFVQIRNPRLKAPFKAYIYCPNSKPVLGRCILDNSLKETPETDFDNYNRDTLFRANGRVIGEFVCDKVYFKNFHLQNVSTITLEDLSELSCLSVDYLTKYADGRNLYGFNITNLVIYDKPKNLREFHTVDKDAVRRCGHRHQSYCSAQCNSGYIKNGFYCDKTADWCTQCTTKPITKTPAPWCYVEELR